jgi:hypothetical protein
MSGPARPSAMPEAVIVRTERSPTRGAFVVTLTHDGIGWEWEGRDGTRWVPWPLVGGLSDVIRGKTWTTKVLALDGSSLGTIIGLVPIDGDATTVAHVVATFRSDLFVEVEGDPWVGKGGCIRRDVGDEPPQEGEGP